MKCSNYDDIQQHHVSPAGGELHHSGLGSLYHPLISGCLAKYYVATTRVSTSQPVRVYVWMTISTRVICLSFRPKKKTKENMKTEESLQWISVVTIILCVWFCCCCCAFFLFAIFKFILIVSVAVRSVTIFAFFHL